MEIKSKELRSAILEYDSIVQHQIEKKNYILAVSEKRVNDSVSQFVLSYDLGTAWLQEEPVSLAKVGDNYVIISSDRIYLGILATPKTLQKEIARRYFPDEYKILDKGLTINTYITNDAPVMNITFCKGKFIKKWMVQANAER